MGMLIRSTAYFSSHESCRCSLTLCDQSRIQPPPLRPPTLPEFAASGRPPARYPHPDPDPPPPSDPLPPVAAAAFLMARVRTPPSPPLLPSSSSPTASVLTDHRGCNPPRLGTPPCDAPARSLTILVAPGPAADGAAGAVAFEGPGTAADWEAAVEVEAGLLSLPLSRPSIGAPPMGAS